MNSNPDNLTESAKDALAFVARKLAGHFTGRLELECAEGGVRAILVHERIEGRDLIRKAG